jgi:hypothetical protein
VPTALLISPGRRSARPSFTVVDFHLHGRELKTADDYQKMIKKMDETGVGVICTWTGIGKSFDRRKSAAVRDRFHFRGSARG